MTALADWIEDEARFAARDMLCAISATHIVKQRPGFGQSMTPRPGSVLASPVPAAYDPDPDYFFHWFRDAAIVVDAMRVALEQGWLKTEALARLREFVAFSQALGQPDGRAFLANSDFRQKTAPSFLQYLRADEDIAALNAGSILADVRVNPDGTLDLTRWARPQNDGAPLLALTLLRWRATITRYQMLGTAMRGLLVADLEFTLASFDRPSFDLWEEESGRHYFTQLVQAEALAQGAEWLAKLGEAALANACRAAAQKIQPRLAALWDPDAGFYRSRSGVRDGDPRKALDIAVVLGALHAGRRSGPHSVLDPKAQASLATLEAFFAGAYPINIGRAAPAIGRHPGDVYYGGGAWYVSTLAAAEFYFRLAAALGSGAAMPETAENARFRVGLGIRGRGAAAGEYAEAAMARGDAFLATVRAFTPPGGELSEQFDKSSGAQTSAKRLAWSYAAFITAAASRRQACAAR